LERKWKQQEEEEPLAKGHRFISILTQFSLRIKVFMVLAGMPDHDSCAPKNWCQNSRELKRLLEVGIIEVRR
jgi:hypothetical protein